MAYSTGQLRHWSTNLLGSIRWRDSEKASHTVRRGTLRFRRIGSVCLDVEEEIDDVAILNDIGFSFSPEGAVRFGRCKAACGDQIIVGNNFGPDEAPLDVTVDRPCRLDSRNAAHDRPGAAF